MDKSWRRGLKLVFTMTTLATKVPLSVDLNKVGFKSFSKNSHSSISLSERIPIFDITIVQLFRDVHSIHVIQNFRISSNKGLMLELSAT